METPVQNYVAGFYYVGNECLLIQKVRPEWQKGKLNGIGGKINPRESPFQAMTREFGEETLLSGRVENTPWKLTVVLRGPGFSVHFFVAEGTDAIMRDAVRCTRRSEEPVVRVFLHRLPPNVIPNLRWIIPLAMDNSISFPLDIAECPACDKRNPAVEVVQTHAAGDVVLEDE